MNDAERKEARKKSAGDSVEGQLWYSAGEGDDERVAAIISRNPDLAITKRFGSCSTTALIEAVKGGHLACVKLIVEALQRENNAELELPRLTSGKTYNPNVSAFSHAVNAGHINIVDYFLTLKPKKDETTFSIGNDDHLGSIVDNSINGISKDFDLAMFYFLFKLKDKDGKPRVRREYDCQHDVSRGYYNSSIVHQLCILEAQNDEALEMIEELLTAKDENNAYFFDLNKRNAYSRIPNSEYQWGPPWKPCTLVEYVIEHKQLAVFNHLMRLHLEGKIELLPNSSLNTPLHQVMMMASSSGQIDLVEDFLKAAKSNPKRFNINAVNHKGKTPLMFAAQAICYIINNSKGDQHAFDNAERLMHLMLSFPNIDLKIRTKYKDFLRDYVDLIPYETVRNRFYAFEEKILNAPKIRIEELTQDNAALMQRIDELTAALKKATISTKPVESDDLMDVDGKRYVPGVDAAAAKATEKPAVKVSDKFTLRLRAGDH